MSNSVPKWNEEREGVLTSIVGSVTPVTAELVETAAGKLETSTRSVASKLRKMGFEVVSLSKDTSKKYTADEEEELKTFLEKNSGKYTYGEVAAAVLGGRFSTKQIQGKVLSMELTSLVKPTPKPESVKTYTNAEETKLLGMLKKGNMFIEDIAEAMSKEVNSVRGKILSLSRTNEWVKIPKQRTYKTKDTVDPFEALGDLSELTVEDIAEKVEKTVRGVKTMLTHRGLKCKNYDGEKRAAKIAEEKKAS